MDSDPIRLGGEFIRLEPLSVDAHLRGLQDAGRYPEVFEWAPEDRSSPDGMRSFVKEALELQTAGKAVPFATVLQESGEVIGSTRFGNLAPTHRRVEIGWTWITPEYQRTRANTEAKYLMLCHAFDRWGCVRVELKTDTRNTRSSEAILRIGATEEGILRKHMQTHQGPRDTVYYSVLDEEWPRVKRDLERRLDQSYSE